MHSVSCSLLWWNIWLTTKALLCSRQVPQHNSKDQCQLMLADKSCPEKSNIKTPPNTRDKPDSGEGIYWASRALETSLGKNRFNQEVRGKVFREQLIQKQNTKEWNQGSASLITSFGFDSMKKPTWKVQPKLCCRPMDSRGKSRVNWLLDASKKQAKAKCLMEVESNSLFDVGGRWMFKEL